MISYSILAIVGVRVHPIDRHIWQPLADTQAHILYLSGPSAASEFSSLCANVGRTGDLSVAKHFNDGLRDLTAFLL